MTKIDLRFKAVDKNTWKDLESLFENKGGPHNCWCMVWRHMNEGTSRSKKSDRKDSLKSYVDSRRPVGLLCYINTEPVGWCSIAPRDSYRELSGDASLERVWSLVCFYVKREYRGQEMSKQFISAALKYAKGNGAKYVEAYPVAPDSPSYRFMGFKPTFERLGFEFRGRAGKRRNVMVSEL